MRFLWNFSQLFLLVMVQNMFMFFLKCRCGTSEKFKYVKQEVQEHILSNESFSVLYVVVSVIFHCTFYFVTLRSCFYINLILLYKFNTQNFPFPNISNFAMFVIKSAC